MAKSPFSDGSEPRNGAKSDEKPDPERSGSERSRKHRSRSSEKGKSRRDYSSGEEEESSKKRKSRRDYSSEDEEESLEKDEDRRKKRRSKERRDYSSEAYSESEDDRRRKRKSRRDSESEDDKSRRKRKSRRDLESDSEEERRRRRRRKRKEKEERERRRRRKKEKEREKKKKDKGKVGAVTNSWGKYGIIKETDMWNKRPEFTAWLLEVKQVNIETLPNWEEKQMFKQFMEDHNTATFPSKKYYGLDAYHRKKIEKEIKRGTKKVVDSERTVFDDEEQRRLELLREREKRKEQEVEELKRSMQSGLAQAMKDQAKLREEMAYHFKVGNFEAAAAIQRRLDPDVPM